MAICEAVETLLEQDFTEQDVWLSFGCNERVSGTAAQLAVRLTRRGVRRGSPSSTRRQSPATRSPGSASPVGVASRSPRRASSIERASTGAANPPRPQPCCATVQIARAIRPARQAPDGGQRARPDDQYAPPAQRPRTAGGPPLMQNAGGSVGADPRAAGQSRPRGGADDVRDDHLLGSPPSTSSPAPRKASVKGIRIMVGDTVDSVLEHVRRTIDDDQVQVTLVEGNDPCPSRRWTRRSKFHQATITDVFPDAVGAMQPTDGSHRPATAFTRITEPVYRFAPFRMSKQQRGRSAPPTSIWGIRRALVEGVGEHQRLIEGILVTVSDPRVRGLAAIVGFLVCVGSQRRAGLPHAHLLEHRRPPRHQGRRRQLDQAAQADRRWSCRRWRGSATSSATRRCCCSTAVHRALGSWILAFAPSFTTFLIGFAIRARTSCGCRSRWRSSTGARPTPGARTCSPGARRRRTRRCPRVRRHHRRADVKSAGGSDLDVLPC